MPKKKEKKVEKKKKSLQHEKFMQKKINKIGALFARKATYLNLLLNGGYEHSRPKEEKIFDWFCGRIWRSWETGEWWCADLQCLSTKRRCCQLVNAVLSADRIDRICRSTCFWRFWLKEVSCVLRLLSFSFFASVPALFCRFLRASHVTSLTERPLPFLARVSGFFPLPTECDYYLPVACLNLPITTRYEYKLQLV